jgi:hypothetical protein
MKNASEWASDLAQLSDEGYNEPGAEGIVRRIQADAMREAALIAKSLYASNFDHSQKKHAGIAIAEQITQAADAAEKA